MKLHIFVFVSFHLLFSSCAIFTPSLEKKYPMKTQPDFSCRTGNMESGAVYYLWQCYEGKRVLIYNVGSGLYWSFNYKTVGECGKKTKYELSKKLDIENKTSCVEYYPPPYLTKGINNPNAKMLKKDQLETCDFVGFRYSYKKTKEEAILDLKKKLSRQYVHAFTEPVFDKGIINSDKWQSRAYVCYGWNQ